MCTCMYNCIDNSWDVPYTGIYWRGIKFGEFLKNININASQIYMYTVFRVIAPVDTNIKSITEISCFHSTDKLFTKNSITDVMIYRYTWYPLYPLTTLSTRCWCGVPFCGCGLHTCQICKILTRQQPIFTKRFPRQ